MKAKILARTSTIAAVAILSTVATSAANASSTNATILDIQGPLVDAAFSWTDPSGCIETDVFVNANEEVAHQSVEAFSQGYAAVSIFQEDMCTFTVLFSAYGEKTSLQPGEMVVSNQLDRATLDTTIPVVDDASGASIPLSVDLTWVGTSAIHRNHSSSNELLYDRCRIVDHWKGTGRDADASGTISDGVTNFAPPGSLQWAEIGDDIVGSAVIQCA